MKKITIYDVEISEHNEFGRIIKATCPDCGQEISSYQYISAYDVRSCKCPRYWTFEIKAVGSPTGQKEG